MNEPFNDIIDELVMSNKLNGNEVWAIGVLKRHADSLEKEVERLKNELGKRAENIALELTKAWCGQDGCADYEKVMQVYKNYVGELTKYV